MKYPRKFLSTHSKKILVPVQKFSFLTPLVIALITASAAISGGYIGQRTSAVSEADKIVRDKLELAYNRSLSFPDMIGNLHDVALPRNMEIGQDALMGRYNQEVLRFSAGIQSIKTPIDLYSDELDRLMANFVACVQDFKIAAVEVFLMNLRIYREAPYGTPQNAATLEKFHFPAQLKSVADKRLECEALNVVLQKSIRQELRKHIPKSIF